MNKTAITKKNYDKELQDKYLVGKLFASFMSTIWSTRILNAILKLSKGKKRKGVKTKNLIIERSGSKPKIPLVIYKPKHVTGSLPIMLYIHGGGYITGSPEMTSGIENFIFKRACIIVAPRYRLALTAPYPAALDDCYDTLLWIKKHHNEIGGWSDRIIIAGNSAGGGLAAAVTLKNRDKKDVDVAFQMPIYPMLDYRNNTESARISLNNPVWNFKNNKLGWKLYLKDLNDNKEPIPSYASPALNSDYTNFPPTISFVGGLEPFKDEVLTYMESLEKVKIPVKFRLFPKAFHGFEAIAPNAKISKEAQQFLLDSYAEFYDKYCLSFNH